MKKRKVMQLAGSWTVTGLKIIKTIDISLSPDQQYLACSSINPYVSFFATDKETESTNIFNFAEGTNSNFGVFGFIK